LLSQWQRCSYDVTRSAVIRRLVELGAEGEGEVRIFGVDSGHSHAAVLGILLGRAFDQQLAKPLT
jgi:hypothetical protein